MGGNVFSGKTSSIKSEYINPTLESYFTELRALFPKKSKIFNTDHFILLGSAGKKAISNDIDLGISNHFIAENSCEDWNLSVDAVAQDYELFKKRARTATDDSLRSKAFLTNVAKYINRNSSIIQCDEKKVSSGNLFSFCPQKTDANEDTDLNVQVDWMVGNIDWLKFSYYSSQYPSDSNIKGLHRTQLLLSTFQAGNLSFNHLSGVKDKDSGKIVATTPQDAVAVLNSRLHTSISLTDTENYYTLHDLLLNSLDKTTYDKVINIYLKILDSTRADIPDNLQETWVKVKNDLSLTGKFLPDNSNLKVYV